jgi:hypothetical protein
VDRYIRMVSVDGEVLGKNRRDKQDKVEVKVEENK